MPEINKLLQLCIDSALDLVLCKYLLSCFGILLTENVDKLDRFAVIENNIRLKSAAAVAVVVQTVVAVSSLDSYRVAVVSVRTDEAFEAAVIVADLLSCKTEESFLSVEASCVLARVLVDMLNDHIAFKGGPCYKQCILEINLILLIVVLVGELDEAEGRELPLLARSVGELCSPYFISLVQRNVVGQLRLYPRILRLNGSICCTVVALALILVKALAYRLPCT